MIELCITSDLSHYNNSLTAHGCHCERQTYLTCGREPVNISAHAKMKLAQTTRAAASVRRASLERKSRAMII